jgi:hypothetical protein
MLNSQNERNITKEDATPPNAKSYWAEIKSDYEPEPDEADGDIKRQIYIDAWGAGSEQGEVIARVIQTTQGDVCVVYLNNIARGDEYAKTVIAETKERLIREETF